MNGEAKFKVVVQKLGGRQIAVYGEGYDIEREILERIGAQLVVVDAGSEEEYIEAAADADAVLSFGGGLRLTRNIISSLKKCKIIGVPSVGFDHVEIPAATDNGIIVTNVPDVFIEEVADHTMALLLASWRRLITQDDVVRTGRWLEARPMLYEYPRLTGLTLGFVAYGNIPKGVTRRAEPFGLRMLAYDPYISELTMTGRGVEPIADLSELLERSDIVSVHLPLSDETYHMISEPEFRQMKSTAIFINTGRGPTVDEPALIKALQEGWIAFAALDVLEKEPVDPDNPLIKMDNVILTAHVASASSRMPPETRRRAAREVALVLEGEQPIHPVNQV
jgi:D-3-phosphoglycerate dehydrogenase